MIGLLRVKNESRWIERVIRSIQPVCERVLVLDDGSTDATPEICADLRASVYRNAATEINETRDKDFLLAKAWETGAKSGDCCLMIDGDEILCPKAPNVIHGLIAGTGVCWSFRVLYLWDQESRVRVDGVYGTFRRPSMFRLTSRDLTFRRTEHGGNLHCSSAPARLLGSAVDAQVRLLHMGYLHKEDRIRKYEWYNRIDPGNPVEDGYRHMVVGDLFPADARFRWGGPLRLEAL